MSKKILDLLIGPILITIITGLIILNDIFFTTETHPENAIYVFISLLVFFSSIVTLCISIYCFYLKQKHLILLAFGFFTFMTSIWGLCQITFITDLFVKADFIPYVKNHIIFVLPLTITLIAYSINNHSKLKIVYTISTICFVVIEVINILLNIFYVDGMNFIYDILFLGIIIYVIILSIMLSKMKVEESKRIVMFSKATVLCVMCFSFELLNGHLNFLGPTGMYLIVCALSMITIAISIIVKDFVKKENYRHYLSEENARLSSSILLSQIKPHFLYNALNSISFLCKKDPKQADMAVIRFSRYLRQNMKCIESTEIVDFGSEMEHIKNYLYLESIRFPKMEIIYELKHINFQVPPLCIQPIVENAVKHGVSKNTAGGYLIIKSYLENKNIIIEVSDNGPGFDTKTDMKGTGLSNISRRLKMLMNAEIEFGSVIGTGTVVRVIIPREGVK